ncbi:MAG: ABC transporter substrate-binding protein [Xanthobacteraceae bacterium]|jgi:putative ABC transport system substrate-binding protein
MKRRDFTLLGGAIVAWPLAARAQQAAMPAIGFLDGRSVDSLTDRLRAFRQGLKDVGYVEGENVTIIYRWAENQVDRLPDLAAELVRRPVAVIVASGGPNVVFAAKAATTTIPILFLTAEDPVRLGLVASLARPGGNLTGINFLNRELASKQLELLRELVPAATRVAVLVDPTNVSVTESILREVGLFARGTGLKVQVLRASTSAEIDAAFAVFTSSASERPNALFVSQDPFLNTRRLQLSLLAMRHGVPAIYSGREFAEVGGVMSYGSNITDAYRQIGAYAGRILKGAKFADLPVVQSSKFELVINVQAARILGLTIPPTLLATADEVIE